MTAHLWPILPEYGSPYRLTVACAECDGTGTAGKGPSAHECVPCQGRGEIEIDPQEERACP